MRRDPPLGPGFKLRGWSVHRGRTGARKYAIKPGLRLLRWSATALLAVPVGIALAVAYVAASIRTVLAPARRR